jgi:hypothetical protein
MYIQHCINMYKILYTQTNLKVCNEKYIILYSYVANKTAIDALLLYKG